MVACCTKRASTCLQGMTSAASNVALIDSTQIIMFGTQPTYAPHTIHRVT